MMNKYYLAGIIAVMAPISSHAFNGILLTGTGQVSAGMGGVSIAGGYDRASISENPANLAFQEDGIDTQLSLLSIHSKSNFLGQAVEHKSDQFLPAPGLAITKRFDDKISYGMSVIGSGGSIDYSEPAIHGYSSDEAKTNLTIMTINPTIAYQPLPKLSFGLSFKLGIEQFRAKGVFAGLDYQNNPMFLPSHGNQWAYGLGYTIGSTWNFMPDWYLGLSYMSETEFSKLDGYKEDLLKSSQGQLNLPERYGVGLKYNISESLSLAADFQFINWKDADGLGKDSGFNWQNQKVYRLGMDYKLNQISSIRFGYNHANEVVDSSDTLVSFYANAVANTSWTVGYGHQFDIGKLNLAYEYAPNHHINGTENSRGTNLRNENHVVTLGFSHNF